MTQETTDKTPLTNNLLRFAEIVERDYMDTPGTLMREAVAEIERLNLALQAATEDARRWIPIQEEMPSYFRSVLCTDGDQVRPSYRTSDDGKWSNWPPNKVTHWMPFPEPPALEAPMGCRDE